jgi:hypothetical protein
MGGCHNDLISPLESPEMCVDGGCWNIEALMVHHTYPRFIQSSARPTFGYSQLGD